VALRYTPTPKSGGRVPGYPCTLMSNVYLSFSPELMILAMKERVHACCESWGLVRDVSRRGLLT